MKQSTLVEKFRYRFDNFMSKGTGALIGGLALISLLIIVVAALVLAVTGISPGDSGERLTFQEAAWEALMRTLDAGTMGGDAGWGYRLVMFLVTIGGVFVISSLIGVLTSGLEGRLEELRRGRSRVIEHGHTILLGWSPQIFTILSELITANANQRSACIVIMGPKDKAEMEDEIAARVEKTGNTRIVCRTGNPIDLADLELVSPQTSKAILLLSAEGENPDADVIKALLAITNSPHRRPEPYHIVAEIRDPKNLEVARMIGKDEVELILVGNLIARIIAQTCRQSGLSAVYTELLDFGGDEIYMKEEKSLVGMTFADTLLQYEDSTVIGIYSPSMGARLNPPMDTRLQSGDQIIAISEDDDTIRLSGRSDYAINTQALSQPDANPPAPEKTLILGWNWRAPTIIAELDHYVAPASLVSVVAHTPEVAAELDALQKEIKNQTLRFTAGDTTDRRVLDGLNITGYDHIIVLSYLDHMETQQADSCTLVTLLHLRDLSEHSRHHFSIISEMLDLRNRELAEVTHADDFIVSDQIISLMLAQVAENKYLNAVLADLFDPEGSEIYLKPASHYVRPGTAVNFYTIVEAARRRGEVAIGYRRRNGAAAPALGNGVVVNPNKSETTPFAEGDHIIVISET